MTILEPLRGEALLLDITRHLVTHGHVAALRADGLKFVAQALGADLALLHVTAHGDQFRLAAHVGDHPLLHLHHTQSLTPRWRSKLLAGTWHSKRLPNPDWDGPPEKSYARLGAQHLACFGLHSGERLVGYVSLMFSAPRPDLDQLNILGAVGALWGTLLERLDAQMALRAREAMLRSITDNGTDIITVLDRHGTVTYQSASVTRMFGVTATDMLNRDALRYVHSDDTARVAQEFARLLVTPDEVARITYRIQRADGAPLWVESRARNLLHDPDVQGVVIHSRDVTDQQDMQCALESRLQELTVMHEASQALMHASSDADVAETVVRLIKAWLRHEFVRVMRVERDGTNRAIAFDDDLAADLTSDPAAVHLPPGEGLTGACIAENATVLARDVLADPRYHPLHSAVRSELVVPLRVNGRVWGAVNVESTRLDAFTAHDRQVLETIAAQAGAALSNVLLVDDLRRSHQDLQDAYDKTITGWAHALDLRDRETEGHSQRVTELTVALARRMGVAEDQLVHVRRGALLHDIGKMGVPDQVLLKPGPLSEDEWRVMRLHPDMARALLTPIKFLEPSLPIPCAHHEKWNGTGYPRGLRGENIPLIARIFAVVDVWDALRSDRPYRSAWTADQTRTFIREQAGQHFDPAVVEEFLALLDAGPTPS